MKEMNEAVYSEDRDEIDLKNLCRIVRESSDEVEIKMKNDVKDELAAWLKTQNDQLDAQVTEILADAKKRANEIASRMVSSAVMENDHERLRVKVECIDKAKVLFQKKLEAFPKRGDYAEILASLAIDAIAMMPKEAKLKLTLGTADQNLKDAVLGIIRSKIGDGADRIVAGEVSNMLGGGIELRTEDGRWHIVSDWRAKTDEMADTIATKVLDVM